MARKLSLILTLTAWLFATGSQWDLVQTFAWGKMLASYSQTMPFATALKKTFSTEGMCGICKAVDDAKQQEASAVPNGKVDAKILLVFQPVASVIMHIADPAVWTLTELAPSSNGRASPPLPPPRELAA